VAGGKKMTNLNEPMLNTLRVEKNSPYFIPGCPIGQILQKMLLKQQESK
jgi:hypothetical protein